MKLHIPNHNLILKILIAVIVLLLACKSFIFPNFLSQNTSNSNSDFTNDEVYDISDNTSEDERAIPISAACLNQVSNSDDYNNSKPTNLYAKYAALIDASNGRVLYEKDGYTPAPNASTTKIMTLIIALQNSNPEQVATISKYAASMPDVQLDINSGEKYYLKDLLYSLMLKSHNDSAVAIAENTAVSYLIKQNIVGNSLVPSINYTLTTFPDTDFTTVDLATVSKEQSKELVHVFACLMNLQAQKLGCTNTYFITPNGLDDQDENGKHSTSAVDLARIMAYCIENKKFLEITEAENHHFNNIVGNADGTYTAGKRTFSLSNANAFIQMMDGVISGKTGFTNDAGYCYVCALKRDDKIFVSTVLASGWPNNKTYKWNDTKKLLTFGLENYFSTNVFSYIDDYKDVNVKNGKTPIIKTCISSDIGMLLSRFDNVNIIYTLPEIVEAPIFENTEVGSAAIYINDQLYCELPILSKTSSEKIDYKFCLSKILSEFIP